MLELNAFVKGAIEGFLSSLALLIFFAILPLVSIERTELKNDCACVTFDPVYREYVLGPNTNPK